MSVITSKILGGAKPSPKPAKQLNYAGQPYDPERGETYGGLPEFQPDKPLPTEQKHKAKVYTSEQRIMMRKRMAHARAVRDSRRNASHSA